VKEPFVIFMASPTPPRPKVTDFYRLFKFSSTEGWKWQKTIPTQNFSGFCFKTTKFPADVVFVVPKLDWLYFYDKEIWIHKSVTKILEQNGARTFSLMRLWKIEEKNLLRRSRCRPLVSRRFVINFNEDQLSWHFNYKNLELSIASLKLRWACAPFTFHWYLG
jgi:hypothetical protein